MMVLTDKGAVHCVCKDRFVLHHGIPRRVTARRGAWRRGDRRSFRLDGSVPTGEYDAGDVNRSCWRLGDDHADGALGTRPCGPCSRRRCHPRSRHPLPPGARPC